VRQVAEPIVDCRGGKIGHVGFGKRRCEDVQPRAKVLDVPSRSTVPQFVLHQLASELGDCLGALNDPEMLDKKLCGFPQASVMWLKEGESSFRVDAIGSRETQADAPSFLRSVRN
jgi:hypothetical protein